MSDSNHVDFSADFMMPAPWSSEDAGDTFETGDYICVFLVGCLAMDLVATAMTYLVDMVVSLP